MTPSPAQRPRPQESRRFALWVYGSLAAFVTLLTVSYLFAEPVMDVVERVIQGLFL
jgi:hypothetical protein